MVHVKIYSIPTTPDQRRGAACLANFQRGPGPFFVGLNSRLNFIGVLFIHIRLFLFRNIRTDCKTSPLFDD
jgi:hypothetical protein